MLIAGVALVVILLAFTIAGSRRRIRIDLESPSMAPPGSAPRPRPQPDPEPAPDTDPAPGAAAEPETESSHPLSEAPLAGANVPPGLACPTCRSVMSPSVLFSESSADFNFELESFEDILEMGPALRAWVEARAAWEPAPGEDHVRVDMMACPNCRTGIMTIRHLVADAEGFDEVVEDRQEIRLAPAVVAALVEAES